MFGTSDFGEFLPVSIQSLKLLHPFLDTIRMEWIGRITRHLGSSPVAGFILSLTNKRTLMLVNVLPAENLFSR